MATKKLPTEDEIKHALNSFCNRDGPTDANKKVLRPLKYIEYTGGLWHLNATGKGKAKKLGIL
jgi:hypothetical protein